MNLYSVPAGTQLDALIEERLFGRKVEPGALPEYSTDETFADRVRSKLRQKYGTIICGNTKIRGKGWFARYGNDPSTSLEVVAETYPLAVCRLALLLSAKDV